MATTEQKCADLIHEKMTEREEEFRSLLNDPNSDDNDEPALSIDKYEIIKVCLSYGGPSDYIEITHDEGDIRSVIYRYSDWFDTATREVPENSSLMDYARYIVEVTSN